jgi:hypothetical protein
VKRGTLQCGGQPTLGATPVQGRATAQGPGRPPVTDGQARWGLAPDDVD